MAGKRGLKKRVWSVDEKRTICAQALTPGISVAQVARRYAMNANLIFKWLKDPRFGPIACAPSPEASVALDGAFLPIQIDEPAVEMPTACAQVNGISADCCPMIMAQRVDISLSDGRRIIVEGPTSLSSVMGLAQGLTG